MKKLPEITINEWLAAEEELRRGWCDTLKEGEHTTDTFAKANNISTMRAQARLYQLYRGKKATRREFNNGHRGLTYAYKLCRNGTNK